MFADIYSIDVNATDIDKDRDTQRGGSDILTMQFKSHAPAKHILFSRCYRSDENVICFTELWCECMEIMNIYGLCGMPIGKLGDYISLE